MKKTSIFSLFIVSILGLVSCAPEETDETAGAPARVHRFSPPHLVHQNGSRYSLKTSEEQARQPLRLEDSLVFDKADPNVSIEITANCLVDGRKSVELKTKITQPEEIKVVSWLPEEVIFRAKAQHNIPSVCDFKFVGRRGHGGPHRFFIRTAPIEVLSEDALILLKENARFIDNKELPVLDSDQLNSYWVVTPEANAADKIKILCEDFAITKKLPADGFFPLSYFDFQKYRAQWLANPTPYCRLIQSRLGIKTQVSSYFRLRLDPGQLYATSRIGINDRGFARIVVAIYNKESTPVFLRVKKSPEKSFRVQPFYRHKVSKDLAFAEQRVNGKSSYKNMKIISSNSEENILQIQPNSTGFIHIETPKIKITGCRQARITDFEYMGFFLSPRGGFLKIHQMTSLDPELSEFEMLREIENPPAKKVWRSGMRKKRPNYSLAKKIGC